MRGNHRVSGITDVFSCCRLYPEGTFNTGCPADGQVPPQSALVGTWTGTISVSETDQAGQTTTRQEETTVSFDQYGQPANNQSPWPSEWPDCFRAGAKREEIVNECGCEQMFTKPQQSTGGVRISQADFSPTSMQLVYHRGSQEATCPEGHRPPETESRTYEADLAGDLVNWSLLITEQRSTFPFGTLTTQITGQLHRP